MQRRLLVVVLVAVALVGLAWWARARDGASRPDAWAPPRLAVGRDAGVRPGLASAAAPELGYGVVACTVDADVGEDPGRLVARSDEAGTAMSSANDRTLTLQLAPGEWQVNWHGGGAGRRSQLRRIGLLEVEAGEVERCHIAMAGWTVQGNVLDQHGEPRVGDTVEGCGGHATTDEGGRFTLTVTRGDCLVRAWAADGMLRRPSEPLYVDAFALPVSPTLRVDASPIGGVGLGLRSAADGLHVTMVAAGSPAEAAGLEVGDVVLGVNGSATAGWSTIHGVEAITGTPGTRVTLRVGTEGGERSVELERARLDEEPPASPLGDTGAE